LIDDQEELNIFDPDSFDTPGRPSLRSAVVDEAETVQRPHIMSDITPGQFMPSEDCFDLFVDFIESDEWLLPIESFIDYFCIVFPTQNSEEHKSEKLKVFAEYRSIIKTNLDSFLYEILNYTKEQLFNLLAQFERHLKFEDMMHILAVEDYSIFHDFMFEAFKAQSKNTSLFSRRFNQDRAQAQASADFSKPITEEELIDRAIKESMKMAGQSPANAGVKQTAAFSEEEQLALAIAASEQEERKRNQLTSESEEDLIRRAIAESQAFEAAQLREEEEKMLEAIKQSEATLHEEQDRLRYL